MSSEASGGLAERLERRLAPLPERRMRVRLAAAMLDAAPAAEAVAALRALLGRRTLAASDAAAACGAGFLDAERREALRRAAREAGAEEVLHLLSESGPARPAPAREDGGDESTLGFRMARARRARPEELLRLAARGEPQVIRNLLENPRVTEDLVVRIAARRPSAGDALLEIAASRFSTRARVIAALVRNPGFPAGEASRLLPRLGDRELRELADDGAVGLELREAARTLAERRAAEARASRGASPAPPRAARASAFRCARGSPPCDREPPDA